MEHLKTKLMIHRINYNNKQQQKLVEAKYVPRIWPKIYFSGTNFQTSCELITSAQKCLYKCMKKGV